MYSFMYLYSVILLTAAIFVNGLQEWDGYGCPRGATGPYPYAPDCRRFYNCWKGRGMLTMCAPGTLFNPKTLECDHPDKVDCQSSQLVKHGGNLVAAYTMQSGYAGNNYYTQQHHAREFSSDNVGQQSSVSTQYIQSYGSYQPRGSSIQLDQPFQHSPEYHQRYPYRPGQQHPPIHHHHQHNPNYHLQNPNFQHNPLYHQHDPKYHQHDPNYHQHDPKYHQHDPKYHQHDPNYHQHNPRPHQNQPTSKDGKTNPSGGSVYKEVDNRNSTTKPDVWHPIKVDEAVPIGDNEQYPVSTLPSIDIRFGRNERAKKYVNQEDQNGQPLKPPSFPVYPIYEPNEQKVHQSHSGVQPPYVLHRKPEQFPQGSYSSQVPDIAVKNFFDKNLPKSSGNKFKVSNGMNTFDVPSSNFNTYSNGHNFQNPTFSTNEKTSQTEPPTKKPESSPTSSGVYQTQAGHSLDLTPFVQTFPSTIEIDQYLNTNNSDTRHSASRNIPKHVPVVVRHEKCPIYFTGLVAHTHCRKYLSCANGRTYLMECADGTRFNPELLMCDYPDKVDCVEDEIDETTTEDNFYSRVEKLFPLPSEGNNDDRLDGDYDLFARFGGNSLRSKDVSVKTTTPTPRSNAIHKSHPDDPHLKGFFIQPTESGADISSKPDMVQISKQGKCAEKNCENQLAEVNSQSAISNNNNNNSHFISTNNGEKHSFRPSDPVKNTKIVFGQATKHDRQVVRLRGGPTQQEGYVEILINESVGWGLLCDLRSQWSHQEADIVCKSMGYTRGAELSWQGNPVSQNITYNSQVAANSVRCVGFEESIMDCYISDENTCDISLDAVWIRCHRNIQSQCLPGEMPLFDQCYNLVIPNEERSHDLVGFSQGEAIAHCQSLGGHLLNIASQVENDFLSEWLVRQESVDTVMTSGVGVSVMGMPIWIWEGSENPFSYHNWWPGWRSSKSVAPQTHASRALCIVMRRRFPCPNFEDKSETRLCDTQYFFWDKEDCGNMANTLPYICKRPANKIGCILGTGLHYRGGANVTTKGNLCRSWDSEEVLPLLTYQISDTDRKLTLSGHNYCRNVGGTDTQPWCFVSLKTGIVKEYCDIPQCSKGIEKSARYAENRCGIKDFPCSLNGECIPKDKVCDGNRDCLNGSDEKNCTGVLQKFTHFQHSKLVGYDLKTSNNTSLSTCAHDCLNIDNCRSFSHNSRENICLLSETNLGLSGALSRHQENWNYYELKAKALHCGGLFVCENGKCLSNSTLCNNKDECGDRSDEKDCAWLKTEFKIKLTESTKNNEGTIQVFAHGKWGLVCDDQFDLRDADVACRNLGYNLGAAEVKRHAFPNGTTGTLDLKFLLDDVECQGDESSLADCRHAGWGVHDCQSHEIAGVVCKLNDLECGNNYWQCHRSKECIPINFLCDAIADCTDGSDEAPELCHEPISVRLVGLGGESRSNKITEGRLEVKRFGVWGTVCDDDFWVNEAQVVCNSLGFQGPAKVYKNAAFGSGSGIIWLDQVHCAGNETSIAECMHDSWGQTNCRHNEDVAIACSPQKINIPELETSKTSIENNFLAIDDILPRKCGVIPPEFYDVPSEFRPRVVSGFETVKGSYPWQASVRVKSVSGKSSHWCGAVIISKYHILTAGHCLRDYIKSYYYIRTGDFDAELVEGTEQELQIDELWIHPNLDNGTRLNNDIAVVKVKEPGFIFDKWVAPVCLPSSSKEITEYRPYTNCTISGWGSDGTPGSGFARTLRAAWLQILPEEQCKSKDVYGSGAITEGMFCAGSLSGGTADSCQGDSGGPLLCTKGDRLTLFGITSWGHGCGKPNSPGVYTNVHHYIKWINNKLINSINN